MTAVAAISVGKWGVGYSSEPPEVSVKGKENSPNGWTTRKASKNVAKFCKSVRKAALWWTLMDIGCGLILQNCLAERKRCRWAAGEMKERKVDEKKFFLEAKKVQISLSCWYSGETCSRGPWLQKAWRFRQRQRRGRSPWSLCRCRSLLLLTQNQETSMRRAKISRFEKAQQSEEKPNWKKGERSGDVVWSRRGSARSHKEKEKVCMSGCLLVLDEEEVDDCENEGGFAWMLFEWECWGFGQIVIVIMCQPARPRASCGMGKTAPSTLWYPSPPLQHVNDDDDAKKN